MARAFTGPLCRFFAATAGADAGGPRSFVAGVERWRRDLAHALGGRLRGELQWSEDPDADGFWSDCGDAGWLALRLFAFYAERSDLELPDTVPALLELDRDYRQAQDQKFERSRYGQLLACRCWLPLAFPFTARVPLPDGESAELGSLPVLHDQLRWLNQRTFQGDETEIGGWIALPAVAGGPLLPAAQRGFAALWLAAQHARHARQPLLIGER
jgi:hypothetical protein